MNTYGTLVGMVAKGLCGQPETETSFGQFYIDIDPKKGLKMPGSSERLPDHEPGVIVRVQFADATRELVLAAARVEVNLPPQQYRISENWRFSTVAASWLHDRRSYIHVLRINNMVLLGMPADYSGELAVELEEFAEGSGLFPLITSFNGDYIGYLLPQRRYNTPHFETRWENLFGPWCGEYFNEISRRVITRLSAAAREEADATGEELPEASFTLKYESSDNNVK